MFTRSSLSFAIGAALVLPAGCKLEEFTAKTTAKMLAQGSIALDREADLQFARDAMPASLKTLETFLVNAPDDPNLLLLLARGYNSYAFAVLEGDLDEAKVTGPDETIDELTRRTKLHYLRGSEYGWRLLDEPELEKAAREADLPALERALAKIEPEQAPALFWTTYGWASTINLSKDDADMMANLTPAEKMMQRVYELDPDYFAGAPIMFFGVLNASKPPALGGEPEVAKRYFEEAMQKHGDSNLLIPFLYARYYAPMVQDRALFDRLLDQVANADVTAHPDLRLNNEVARDRARFWKKHVDEIILE